MPHKLAVARICAIRGRDREVLRALIEEHSLLEAELAERLKMGYHNLRTRVARIYAILGVASRTELYALYHVAVLGSCRCSPE